MNKDLKKKPLKLDEVRPNFFRFRDVGGKILLTNDFGAHVFLEKPDFESFVGGFLAEDHPRIKDLKKYGFLKSDLNVDSSIRLYRSRNSSIFYGPFLHILVTTLRCNYKCIYCQASSVAVGESKYDMTIETARRAVDFIFSTPAPAITIEFQGGEPLANWPVVKFVTEYARKKEAELGKKTFLALVSNFSMLDEEKLNFLSKNYVGLCTSLDGPEGLHNINRPLPGGNSYQQTVYWIKKIRDEEERKRDAGEDVYRVSALLTVSKHSLKYPGEIIDEYLKFGFDGIHLRALSNLGYSNLFKDSIGYTAEEFINFWRTSLDYIIDLNKRGVFFVERGSAIILKKIIRALDPGFVDLKSPCGAVIDQILYNYDGKIFTCDEGRMCAGDTFQIGSVTKDSHKDNYSGIISGDKVKTMVVTSTLDNSPCDYCAYKPYCGVCPVVNYMETGSMNPQITNTGWCKRHKAMFDYLFEKLQDEEVEKIFKSWVEGQAV